jgi:biopolymer transport protein ExbD
MATPANSEDDLIAGINVTPLVDVTLVLLIIFMVTAKLIGSPAVPMVVPRSSVSVEVQSPLSLELYAGGAVRIGGQDIASDAAVLQRVREARAKDPDLRAVIRADTSVPHGRVLRAIELIKTGGVERIAFAVAPGEGGALIAPAPAP